ncbi:MAG: hypothetical protein ABIK09_08875 [Pseudomonadota bacterium]
MPTGRCALSCLATLAIVTAVGAARADDPFADLPSLEARPTTQDRGDLVKIPQGTAPQAPELAPPFPPEEEPLTGAPYSAPPLAVIRTSPAGDDVRTDTVMVEFNQPMVGLDTLDVPDIAIPPFSVEPRIPGRTLWLSSSVAAFRVAGGLPRDQEFEVLVPGGLGAPSGRRLDRRVHWSFHTGTGPGLAPPDMHTPVIADDDEALEPSGPSALPLLASTGSPSAPIPMLEAALDLDQGFPDLHAALASPAVPPGGTLDLSVTVHPTAGEPRSAGVTITGISEATGEVFFQRGGLLTDPSGDLKLPIPAPAQEGFCRLYVVAAEDDLRVAVTGLRAWIRAPLVLHAELPSRTRAGDRFSIGAVVRSRAQEPREILVRVRAAGAEVDSDPVRLTLAPGAMERIRVDAATLVPGDAVFQVAAALASSSPERALVHQTITVRVLPCEPVQRAAAYGVVDNALRIPFTSPGRVCPHTGGLEVSVAPDPRMILTDALLHLLEGDGAFGGADDLASRILALVAVRDSGRRVPLSALSAVLREAATIDGSTRDLLALQREDGGFNPRYGAQPSDLYTSARCAAALVAARRAGVEIPPPAMARLTRFLAEKVEATGVEAPHPALLALTLRALALMGISATAQLDALYLATSGRGAVNPRTVPLYARAWLMEALHALDPSDVRIEELHQGLREAALERRDGVTFPEDPDGITPGALHTPDLTDAVVLHALLTTGPSETLIPRITSGLIGSMRRGRWSTPHVDTWALMALSRYYEDLTGDRPSYEARAWLGERMFLGLGFRRAQDHARGRIPMTELQDLGEEMIRIGKRGDGRLFYRVALTSSPRWAPTAAEDHGLLVERAWSLVEPARAADRDGPFRVVVREGDLVRLRIRVVTAEVRRRTVVDIPIPAGLSPSSGTADGAAVSPTRWDATEDLGTWIRLFQDVMAPGVYEWTVILRASTPGSWPLPPVRASAIHTPGVSGWSASEEVLILPRAPVSD